MRFSGISYALKMDVPSSGNFKELKKTPRALLAPIEPTAFLSTNIATTNFKATRSSILIKTQLLLDQIAGIYYIQEAPSPTMLSLN